MYLQSACRVEQDTDWSGHTRLVSPSDLSGHVRTEGWAQGPEYTLYCTVYRCDWAGVLEPGRERQRCGDGNTTHEPEDSLFSPSNGMAPYTSACMYSLRLAHTMSLVYSCTIGPKPQPHSQATPTFPLLVVCPWGMAWKWGYLNHRNNSRFTNGGAIKDQAFMWKKNSTQPWGAEDMRFNLANWNKRKDWRKKGREKVWGMLGEGEKGGKQAFIPI